MKLGLFAVLVSVGCVVVGCAADDGATKGDDANVTAGATRVTGTKAKRLMGAFELVDVVDHAMGGRASIDMKALSCITSANTELDETDPSFNVPSTTCSFEAVGFEPGHHSVTDAPAQGSVMFDALVAVDGSLADSGAGSSFIDIDSLKCSGDGPGAGNDPRNPSPTTATCTIKAQGKTFSADGPKALRVVQALAFANAVDYAMGGRFSVEASALSCEYHSNNALDESNPLVGLDNASCTFKVDGRSVALTDPAPQARAISEALKNAGLQPDSSAGGHTGVETAKLDCLVLPDHPLSCNLAR